MVAIAARAAEACDAASSRFSHTSTFGLHKLSTTGRVSAAGASRVQAHPQRLPGHMQRGLLAPGDIVARQSPYRRERLGVGGASATRKEKAACPERHHGSWDVGEVWKEALGRFGMWDLEACYGMWNIDGLHIHRCKWVADLSRRFEVAVVLNINRC